MKARNGAQPGNGVRGFSLVEMVTVLAIFFIIGGIGFVALKPVSQDQKVANSYNIVLGALRQARENSIAQRTSYGVIFNDFAVPHTITIQPMFAGFAAANPPVTYALAKDVRFSAEPGIPTGSMFTPDGFGSGAKGIDFGYTAQGGAAGEKAVYFCPDGTAQNQLAANGLCQGSWSNGVVYVARPGETMSSRAITVWGATGRIRGWRLETVSGGPKWNRR